MPWHDDSWRDTYDAWKLRSPEDEYDNGEPAEECQHEDYDIDWGSMRATCSCGHAWWMSADEIQAAVDRQRAYDEWCAYQMRPWNRFKAWWRSTRLVTWVRSRWWAWKHPRTEVDDEIPF